MQRWDVKLTLRLMLIPAIGFACAAAGQDDPDALRRLRRNAVVRVVEQTRNSIVNISAKKKDFYVRRPSFFGVYFDEIFVLPKETSGSGFVIHEDGYIVTNAHVVAQTTEHHVRFADGRDYEARVQASDARNDLAILKIEPDEPLVPLKLGRSDDIMIGEDAVAIGNPFGLENTVTRGVISALHRDIKFSEDLTYRDLIQTDASINPGNSGGPLLNIAGELIGVNSAIRPEAENVGFAIPVDRLKDLLPALLDISRLKRVRLGMQVKGANAQVVALDDGSPADKADIELGDRVVEVDGRPILQGADFHIALLGYDAGDTVPMIIERKGARLPKLVRLVEVPKPEGSQLAWEKLGIRLKPLPAKGVRILKVRRDTGLLIVEVDPGGPASQLGIRPADLLYMLGDYHAWPLEQVGALLDQVRRGDRVPIEFLRFYTNHAPDRFYGTLFAR